ncbi:concanavalin A-like lectin/glucanase domain-containing protein [Xylariales sp. PMI_506]|nr:concanavalin A-like lectin/glucanase domain-containing protein [Xylariales sp. PMI_506]
MSPSSPKLKDLSQVLSPELECRRVRGMAAYSRIQNYQGQSLLNGFGFFTGPDPNNGFVNYLSQAEAQANHLVAIDATNNNRVRLQADHTTTLTPGGIGRNSVRLTSFEGFTHGLFIADFQHMPGSVCGSWPAFWAFNNADNGAYYPVGGEIDIIEGANTAMTNLYSSHTLPGCSTSNTGFTGQQGPTDCGPGHNNIGCNYAAPLDDTTSYGDPFNAVGGGVYAMQWESDGIKIWHFPRNAIPYDILGAPAITPNPDNWGPPQALFGGPSCDTDTFYSNMSLVVDMNFCGDYAGNVWGVTDKCNALNATCENFVANNPAAFANVYWDINYIDVYTQSPTSNIKAVATGKTKPTVTRTLSTVLPEPTDQNPPKIGGATYLGCVGSASGYPNFKSVLDSPSMTNDLCISKCAGYQFAGVYKTTCYCAHEAGDVSGTDSARCNQPCPGNAKESCGGLVSTTGNLTGPTSPSGGAGGVAGAPGMGSGVPRPTSSAAGSGTPPLQKRVLDSLHKDRRDAPSSILLTLYGNVSSNPPPGAPPMGGPILITEVLTVTYSAICATNPAQLVVYEYCSTATYPDCPTAQTHPQIPMTTAVQKCDRCGPSGENSITLSLPKDLASASPGQVSAVSTIVPASAMATGASAGPYARPSPNNVATSGASRPSVALSGIINWGILGLLSVLGVMIAM